MTPVETIVAVLALAGGFFTFVGSIGLFKLQDFFMRLHGPTKATTLGVGGVLLASSVHFSAGDGISLRELLVTFFLFMTAPVSAHMLAKAALHVGIEAKGRQPSGEDRTDRADGSDTEEGVSPDAP